MSSRLKLERRFLSTDPHVEVRTQRGTPPSSAVHGNGPAHVPPLTLVPTPCVHAPNRRDRRQLHGKKKNFAHSYDSFVMGGALGRARREANPGPSFIGLGHGADEVLAKVTAPDDQDDKTVVLSPPHDARTGAGDLVRGLQLSLRASLVLLRGVHCLLLLRFSPLLIAVAAFLSSSLAFLSPSLRSPASRWRKKGARTRTRARRPWPAQARSRTALPPRRDRSKSPGSAGFTDGAYGAVTRAHVSVVVKKEVLGCKETVLEVGRGRVEAFERRLRRPGRTQRRGRPTRRTSPLPYRSLPGDVRRERRRTPEATSFSVDPRRRSAHFYGRTPAERNS